MWEPLQVDPLSDSGWARLSASGSLFTSPPWLRAIAATYGFDARSIMLTTGDEPVAGLPFAAIDDVLGPRLVSFPFSDYCDPISTNGVAPADLADALLQLDLPVRLRLLRAGDAPPSPEFKLVGRAAWHGIDLERDALEIWTSLASAARRGIRKARGRGLTVRVAKDSAAVETFHELHRNLRRHKYRMLAQPRAQFEHLRAEFDPSDGFAILVAELDGIPVAATVYLVWDDTLYYKYNASSSGNLDLRPNDLLVWAGIEYGQSRGLRRLDFGLSDLDQPGLIAFKEKFATESGHVSTLVDSRPHPLPPRSAEVRAMLSSLTEQLTADGMPDEVVRQAGESFYRYFA